MVMLSVHKYESVGLILPAFSRDILCLENLIYNALEDDITISFNLVPLRDEYLKNKTSFLKVLLSDL